MLESDVRYFGVFAHSYQPPREVFLPDGRQMQVVPGTNEEIFPQCYRPILMDGETLPPALVFSLYPTLREWMRQAHPQEFDLIREKIWQRPEKEYAILGDPYLHVILPLLPSKDQTMLLQIGRMAFVHDFGFRPQGLWLPELAVSYKTLELARESGYKFVVLRDSQIESKEQNPMYARFGTGRELAVVHFDKALSSQVSFDDEATQNADRFLNRVDGNRPLMAIGSDIELYGHHRPGALAWLDYLQRLDTLAGHGFTPLSIKTLLARGEHAYTNVVERSSWSCEHDLGRWTGECGCDEASWETQAVKRSLLCQLAEANSMINQDLDRVDLQWRDEFIWAFLQLRRKIFTGQDFLGDLKQMVSREKFRLFSAKIYTLIGFTSCGWFFGKTDSPERAIPVTMSRAADEFLGALVPGR